MLNTNFCINRSVLRAKAVRFVTSYQASILSHGISNTVEAQSNMVLIDFSLNMNRKNVHVVE